MQLKQALKLKAEAEASKQILGKKMREGFEKQLLKERMQHKEEIKRWKEALGTARRDAAEKAEKMTADFKESRPALNGKDQERLVKENRQLRKQLEKAQGTKNK